MSRFKIEELIAEADAGHNLDDAARSDDCDACGRGRSYDWDHFCDLAAELARLRQDEAAGYKRGLKTAIESCPHRKETWEDKGLRGDYNTALVDYITVLQKMLLLAETPTDTPS